MRRFVIIVFLGGLSLISSAQSCIPDYIHFYLQSQIDSFQINYPGCTQIEGDVIISGNDITNLIGLVVLTSIGGELRIEQASSLTKLYGLNNISFIGGELNIEENESLFNLEGLSSLVHINESLKIKENPSLISLAGLDNLTTIGVDLNIGCSNYSWTGNPLLNNLSRLHSLTSIGNSISICNNHGLTDLSGIENLTSVENIRISSNDNLSSLTGLQGVTNVDGYISIGWSDLLNSLCGLNNLTTTGSLLLFRLPSLNDLSGLERLCTVGNDLTISSNFSIISLTSLDSLNYIGGKLNIESNYDLVDLSGLENLTEIGGDLTIRANYELIEISGLENLTEIGGGLEINNNHLLTSIDAFSSITSIGGDLIITSNHTIDGLAGLSGVTSIGGDLIITSNFTIDGLVGLSGVISIGGNLVIGGNFLTSLAGIENIITSSIENLRITSERMLIEGAMPNICEYLADPNGAVDIYRNKYPYNNPAKFANECGFTLPCLPYGNYHFFFQSDIDSFQTNYPECTDLGGSLLLHGGIGGGTGNYTNLDGLSVVTSIDGTLGISSADSLTSLSGIDNIDATSISDLVISNCPLLSECEVQSICDYIADPNGDLYISDNAYGCNSPDEVQEACETVSIQEQDLETLFNVYPSPASHYLFVDNRSSHEINKILIYNIMGQIINSWDYQEPLIHISELDQGVYILEIITDDLRERIKFIVRN